MGVRKAGVTVRGANPTFNRCIPGNVDEARQTLEVRVAQSGADEA